MSNTAIKVEHLSKMYRLGEINNGTLWQDIQTWAAIKLKKEDPHSKIGENKYSGDKDHFWALKDISFDVKQGDRLGIIGKNGAGKSTLLKILSRITTPTEGIIKIKGKIASLLEVGTGFHQELTGRDNIYINGAILGMKKRRIDEKLDEIIYFSGIEKHIDTPVKRYSSGMYVRLAFAVAAHLDSDILIADEVLAVGDAEFQKKALGKMQDLSTSEGRTVLFVSHNMGAVKELCFNGLLIDNGKFSAYSDLQTTINSYYKAINQKSFNDLKWYKPNYNKTDIQLLSFEKNPNFNDGNELTFNLFEDISFRIKFINGSTPLIVETPLSISGIDGNGVLTAVTNANNQVSLKENTMYFIDYKIENRFLPGKYRVHFGINYKNDTILWATDIAIFEIINPEKKEIPGAGSFFINSNISLKETNI
ncbi:ABC transporter ATP-binding protein [Treponema sp. R6D11]